VSINTALNAFLAILEERPESAREQFGSLPDKISAAEIATIQGRIQQALQNIRSEAVVAAVRHMYGETLRLGQGKDEAFLEGVQAVEEIMARTIECCEDVQKIVGPGKPVKGGEVSSVRVG
jgi:hypothetical protein